MDGRGIPVESQRTRLWADIPYATVDGEDEIKGEIKSIVTIPVLTNSIVYCNIYDLSHNTPFFFSNNILVRKFKTRPYKKKFKTRNMVL